MEMLQLRYFYESALTESFSKTAEKYMVPSSSVSSSVRQLEKELGCKLFDRTSNRILLNNNGKKLMQTLHLFLSNLDNVVQELSATEFDTTEIKILVRAMRSDITDYIIEFNKLNPHISFNIVFNFDEKNFSSYDIIVDKMTDSYPEYDRFEQFDVRIRLNVNAGNPLLKDRLTLKQLSGRPFITLDENSNMHSMLLDKCQMAGFVPKVVAKTNDVLCYEKMIASGLGIGLMRETGNNPKNIRSLNVVDFNEKYKVYTYFKKENESKNVSQFLQFLKSKI